MIFCGPLHGIYSDDLGREGASVGCMMHRIQRAPSFFAIPPCVHKYSRPASLPVPSPAVRVYDYLAGTQGMGWNRKKCSNRSVPTG